VAGASEQAEVCANKHHENAALIPRVDTIDQSALSWDEPLRRAIPTCRAMLLSVVECRLMKMARNGPLKVREYCVDQALLRQDDEMVAGLLPRCARRHKPGIQTCKDREGRQSATLF
jgi:hypothetical protein